MKTEIITPPLTAAYQRIFNITMTHLKCCRDASPEFFSDI